jgi:hypothetical protein
MMLLGHSSNILNNKNVYKYNKGNLDLPAGPCIKHIAGSGLEQATAVCRTARF